MKFLVDINVGKLARWLRMMGYDAELFGNQDDNKLVKTALSEGRVLLTKDTHITERRVVTSGQLKVALLRDDDPERQLEQVVRELGLDRDMRPFTRCIECNGILEPRDKKDIEGQVPPYVFRTQDSYMQCSSCRRIYWRGTHWQAMTRMLDKLLGGKQ